MNSLSKTRWRRKWFVAIGCVIVVVSAIIVFTYCGVRRRIFERYSGVSLKVMDSIVSVDDRMTTSFMDGDYTAVVRLNGSSVTWLRTHPPVGYKGGWQAGRMKNLAARLGITNQEHLISIEGREGDVFRILTVDLDRRLLYFEMRTF